jgi:20S proteasome alpha/beta subunit
LGLTIIAYKNGVLASDSRVTFNDLVLSDTIKKIHQHDGVMGGASGDASATHDFIKWIKKGANLKKLPKGKYRGLVILDRSLLEGSKKIQMIHVDNQDEYFEVFDEFTAIGSGDKIAIGAMSAGATAEEAVRIASEKITSCGGAIQIERFW